MKIVEIAKSEEIHVLNCLGLIAIIGIMKKYK